MMLLLQSGVAIESNYNGRRDVAAFVQYATANIGEEPTLRR